LFEKRTSCGNFFQPLLDLSQADDADAYCNYLVCMKVLSFVLQANTPTITPILLRERWNVVHGFIDIVQPHGNFHFSCFAHTTAGRSYRVSADSSSNLFLSMGEFNMKDI
jgi:hypothetical protein